jgi:DNA-directed RNA polymerase specialized sigma24 family protein
MKTRRGTPTLGYQSKLHAAKALQDMGLSLTAIAKRMGMKKGGVAALLHHARKTQLDLTEQCPLKPWPA